MRLMNRAPRSAHRAQSAALVVAVCLSASGDAARIEPAPGTTYTNATDGRQYLWIPPGEFLMGCVPNDSDCDVSEKPRHRVRLTRGFWMSRTETTIGAYRAFVKATGHRTRAEQEGRGRFWPHGEHEWRWIAGLKWSGPLRADQSGHDDWPAVQISWMDADAYCRWAGGRLPTEAEWERAARANNDGTRFPWGNASTPEVDGGRYANTADEITKRTFPDWDYVAGYVDGYVEIAPVGRFLPNAWGLHDMAGNVFEWTADWFAEGYYGTSAAEDPSGPASGEARVLRGGGWGYSPKQLRMSDRAYSDPDFWTATFGFRCVIDAASG